MKKIIIAVLGISFLLIFLYVYKQSHEKIGNAAVRVQSSQGDFLPIDWKSCHDLPQKLIKCEPFSCSNPVGPALEVVHWPLQTTRIVINGLTKDNKCIFRDGGWPGEPDIFIIKCSLDKAQIQEVSKYYKRLISAPEKNWWSLLRGNELDNYIQGNPFGGFQASGSCVAIAWTPD